MVCTITTVLSLVNRQSLLCVMLNSPGGKLKVQGGFTVVATHKETDDTFKIIVIEGTGRISLLSQGVASRMGLIGRNIDTVIKDWNWNYVL